MHKSNIYRKLAFLGIIAAFAIGCSTEKDAALNVGYHNMTARYNGYFNAGEIINQTLDSYRNSSKDDYTELLELQVFPDEENATSVFPDLDLAIEKCSKVIYRHSMPDPNIVSSKEKENCRWIDDNWFLIGKSHFVKREYDKAEEKFNYIINEYDGESSLYAAEIWLAKLYIQQEDFSKAKLQLIKVKGQKEKSDENKKSIMDFIKKDKSSGRKKKKSKYQRKREKREKKKNKNVEPAEFTKKLKVEYEVTMADLYIKQEDYKTAVTHLEKAVDLSNKKREKARYEFVLGQLYQKMGSNSQASEHYEKVVKSSAPYEMRFYAKINKTLLSNGNKEEVEKDLEKMLKDDKNDEYKDQIYYVMAELDLKESNRAGAIVNLSKSVFFSVNNDRQKAKSYLKLADMHFEDKFYIKSQKYYDSCITVLPKENENFSMIENKAKSLSNLVVNYETYIHEDSLQRIVAIPEKEREKRLKQILKQIKEAEKQRKINERIRLEAQQQRINSVTTVNGAGSKWYFYNDKAIGKGYNDFKQLWSNRQNEDDWRRSSKNVISEFVDVETDSTKVSVDSLTVDVLRDGLPLSEGDMEKSTDMLITSIYNLGMIYKNQLSEEGEAIDYFTKIIDMEREHEKVLPSAYQLYLIYKGKESGKSNKYKDYILSNYPNSDITKLMADPEYFEKKKKLERKDLDGYKIVLKDFSYRRYIDVITACNKVIFYDKDNKYINKYYLLKAKSISETGTKIY